MKRKVLLTVALIFGLGFSSVFAQEWSPAQKEIWKNVNTYWDLFAKGDLNGYLDYFHPDYVGWGTNDPLPTTCADMKKIVPVMFQGMKISLYVIKPLAIKIYGDVAFVHYNYTLVTELKDGKKNTEMGNWTDILLKQGSKWLMIGDHGGTTKKE